MIKNILITGANGQLGSEMQKLATAHSQYTYYFTDVNELDICNEQAVNDYISAHSIDAVVNCAAYTAVDKAESDEAFCRLLNATAPGYLARAVQKRNGVIIQVSTDYVFDGTRHQPYTEELPTCPASVYGHTKLEGEQEVMQGCEQAVVIRTAWLYSEYGANFVKTMIRLGKEKEQLGVIFDQVGTPTYAGDLAQAIYAILNHGAVRGVYHFSNEGVCSWYDFTKAIHRIAGITTCTVNPLHTIDYPTPAQRPHYSVLDKTKIKQTYSITIPHWEESLRQCIELLEK